jgi:hypothetical protein
MSRLLPFKVAEAIRKNPKQKQAAIEKAIAVLRNRRLAGNLSTQGHTDLLNLEMELESCTKS